MNMPRSLSSSPGTVLKTLFLPLDRFHDLFLLGFSGYKKWFLRSLQQNIHSQWTRDQALLSCQNCLQAHGWLWAVCYTFLCFLNAYQIALWIHWFPQHNHPRPCILLSNYHSRKPSRNWKNLSSFASPRPMKQCKTPAGWRHILLPRYLRMVFDWYAMYQWS